MYNVIFMFLAMQQIIGQTVHKQAYICGNFSKYSIIVMIVVVQWKNTYLSYMIVDLVDR